MNPKENIIKFSCLVLSAFLICSCQSETRVDQSKKDNYGFSSITKNQSGIDFNNALIDDPTGDRNCLSYQHYFNGAGVGVGDFNNDNLPDIFFAGNEVANAIYINKGELKFEKLKDDESFNKGKFWASGVSIIDINNDGFDDVYVCQQGPHDEKERRNLFYINNGDLTFTERAKEMGLDDPNLSTQATFFDYDKDGDLDCYVLNESKYVYTVLKVVYEDLEDEENMRAASGRLFENIGNLTFKDVTKEAGVLKYGYGLGVNITDFNNDNWPDLYVANDYTVPDFMFINQKDGTFKESVKDYTRQISYFAMGCDAADINNDGLVDLAVVDMASEDHFRDKTLMAGMNVDLFKYYFEDLGYQYQYMFNSLQLNNGNNTFSNIAASAGILKSDWSWSAIFQDLNLDGHKDLYVTNGFRRYSRDNDFRILLAKYRKEYNDNIPDDKRREIYKLLPAIKLKNKLYINNKNLGFTDSPDYFKHPEIETYSYGAALADFDNDGDMDIIINNVDQKATLLQNNCQENSHKNFIKIKLNGAPAAKIGAKVTVETNELSQLQEYYFVRGYESCNEEILTFGLGEEQKINHVSIIWPDGTVQKVENPKSNQTLSIDYSKDGSQKYSPVTDANSYLTKSSNSDIPFKHIENSFDDFEKEILLPQKQTAFGPALVKGDVNNDGLEDVFVGGAKNQKSQLYLQQKNGSFTPSPKQNWHNDLFSEDVDAAFIDPNQDGHLDLIILSGGSGDFVNEEDKLEDRFYANDGNGNFFRIANVLPNLKTASYKIIAKNIDQDPEKELLILGAAKPGQYPRSERTFLYDYQGKKYVDVSESRIPELNENKGLIRDAVWIDVDNDSDLDLITVGEWQGVHTFLNTDGNFTMDQNSWSDTEKLGWWKSIKASDLDGDGDLDLVLGNIGKNFKQKASKDYPLFLYSNDFDGNGTLDCVLAKTYDDKIVPTRGRQCSSEQMPFIAEKFETYKDFASASVIDILGNDKIEEGIQLKAVNFYSYIAWNEGNGFEFEKLPALAQIAPINDILIDDINDDKRPDIILVGNDYNTEYETPRLDAGNGLVLLNLEDEFKPVSVVESGMFSPGDTRRITSVNTPKGRMYLVANNNGPIDCYTLKNETQ